MKWLLFFSKEATIEAIEVKQKALDQISDCSLSNKKNLQKVDISTRESCETGTHKKIETKISSTKKLEYCKRKENSTQERMKISLKEFFTSIGIMKTQETDFLVPFFNDPSIITDHSGVKETVFELLSLKNL